LALPSHIHSGERFVGRYDLYERKRPIGLIITLLIILMVALAAGAWFYINPQVVEAGNSGLTTQELALPVTPNQEQSAPANTLNLSSETEPKISTEEPSTDSGPALPALENSDDFFREQATRLSPGFNPWLKEDELIRKFVIIANDFSQGLRIYKHMKPFTLTEPFIAEKDNQGLYLSPKSYQRYNQLASAIDDINVKDGLQTYLTFNALFQQIFKEFSYPESYSVDDLFQKAAAELLTAPVIDSRIALVKATLGYKFADQKLETLNPVHKQMIRMGPQNTRIIQNKLRLLTEGLANMTP
jgi:hypothetical protein